MKLLKPLETHDVPVHDEAEDQRAAALGEARARRADQVHRVDRRRQAAASGLSRACATTRSRTRSGANRSGSAFGVRAVQRAVAGVDGEPPAAGEASGPTPRERDPNAEPRTTNAGTSNVRSTRQPAATLEDARKDGVLTLPDGDTLKVTNLHKLFWPKQKLTKGDLLRYYARVAPFILPAVADRPLVMKRFPNGVAGAAVLSAPRARGAAGRPHRDVVGVVEERPQIIGGSLKTLLYMTQLAAISQDPWFSRVGASGVRRLRRVRSRSVRRRAVRAGARRRALDSRRARRARRDRRRRRRPGADGLHIYVPLPPGTPYEAGMLYCQIVAAIVEQKHPKVATDRAQREGARASASTSTACRTSSARRWRPPTARAPATTPASRRR